MCKAPSSGVAISAFKFKFETNVSFFRLSFFRFSTVRMCVCCCCCCFAPIAVRPYFESQVRGVFRCSLAELLAGQWVALGICDVHRRLGLLFDLTNQLLLRQHGARLLRFTRVPDWMVGTRTEEHQHQAILILDGPARR